MMKLHHAARLFWDTRDLWIVVVAVLVCGVAVVCCSGCDQIAYGSIYTDQQWRDMNNRLIELEKFRDRLDPPPQCDMRAQIPQRDHHAWIGEGSGSN